MGMVGKLIIVMITGLVNCIESGRLEGHVVGGNISNIKNLPHAAFLDIECHNQDGVYEFYICGASILNQVILLTAAHCLEQCTESSYIAVNAGNVHRGKGVARSVSKFIVHEAYDTVKVQNDLGLVRLNRDLKLGKTVAKVAIMERPPYKKTAIVSGWGIVDENKQETSVLLMQATQRVWSRASCLAVLEDMPVGTFCAGERRGTSYAAPGDSGSALVVHWYIQIGLVSYRNQFISESLVVYTDIGYFYNWISKNAVALYCTDK